MKLIRQNNSSLNDILHSTDPHQISEQNVTHLVKIFEEIQCIEAMKLLEEHINKTQSIIPLVANQDDEKYAMLNRKYLLNQKNDCNNNNILINSNNTNINSVTVVVGNQSKFPLRWKRRQLINCLLLFIILSIILLGLVIIGSLQINRLKMNCEQIKNLNQTIQQLTNKVERLNKEQQFTEGSTCDCSEWCRNHSSRYGVCVNGHTCICTMQPITKDSIGDACTCNSWCQKRGHKNGGICGDGYTCICSK